MAKSRSALMWAIDTRSPEGHGLYGQFCPGLPAMWSTRREAREAIAQLFPADCWSRVGSINPWRPIAVKVTVTVTPASADGGGA
jgi:hypothetical protein